MQVSTLEIPKAPQKGQNTPACARALKSLARVEKELEKLRGKEYELPFGSMARARVSRKWDYYAQERMALLATLESATAREVLAGITGK